MVEEEEEEGLDPSGDIVEENEPKKRCCEALCTPIQWLKMLCMEMRWSFVLGVVAVYGISQGLGGALSRVGREYYMKDVQKMQPSEAQFYQGIFCISWIVKPIWGLLTDVFPVFGYRRRPYFIFAGSIGAISIAPVIVPRKAASRICHLGINRWKCWSSCGRCYACVAQNSISHRLLASDMQSLSAFSSSIGALVGFSISGIFFHLIGPKVSFF